MGKVEVVMFSSVKSHFERCSANVADTYAAIVREAKRLGQTREEAKKTSIHLARRTAFAGVAGSEPR